MILMEKKLLEHLQKKLQKTNQKEFGIEKSNIEKMRYMLNVKITIIRLIIGLIKKT